MQSLNVVSLSLRERMNNTERKTIEEEADSSVHSIRKRLPKKK